MARIAIIDFRNGQLFIEDVDQNEIDKYHSVESYIQDNYQSFDFLDHDWSWSYIDTIWYLPKDGMIWRHPKLD